MVLAVVAPGALGRPSSRSGPFCPSWRSLTLRPGQVGTTQAVLATIEFTGFWIPTAIGAIADHAGLSRAVGAYALWVPHSPDWRGR